MEPDILWRWQGFKKKEKKFREKKKEKEKVCYNKLMPMYKYSSKDGKHSRDLLSTKFLSPEEDPPREVEIDGETVTLYRVNEVSETPIQKINLSSWNFSKRT